MKEIIENIKDSMSWYCFDLTDEQVKEYLEKNPIKWGFDTCEREEFADYLALKITGLKFPTYGDSEEYKNKFEVLMSENCKKLGYKWDRYTEN